MDTGTEATHNEALGLSADVEHHGFRVKAVWSTAERNHEVMLGQQCLHHGEQPQQFQPPGSSAVPSALPSALPLLYLCLHVPPVCEPGPSPVARGGSLGSVYECVVSI